MRSTVAEADANDVSEAGAVFVCRRFASLYSYMSFTSHKWVIFVFFVRTNG